MTPEDALAKAGLTPAHAASNRCQLRHGGQDRVAAFVSGHGSFVDGQPATLPLGFAVEIEAVVEVTG